MQQHISTRQIVGNLISSNGIPTNRKMRRLMKHKPKLVSNGYVMGAMRQEGITHSFPVSAACSKRELRLSTTTLSLQ